ncbi:MAG: hypothetical protein QN187_01670 [Armatimonadota bacterium]|nr:hypothetical protein [Armatimonadota bacterium]MDR7518730.1 hypothetical protein [Armatimonadota bacterium]MDR7551227.1 hypothetical protein [Armatimonadota bacterium]
MTRRMAFRVLVAAGDSGFCSALRDLVEATRTLLPIPIEVEDAATLAQVRDRLAAWSPDVLLLDWHLVPSGLPGALQGLSAEHPDLRLLVLLPESRRQYRAAAWQAGACACVPRDRIDPEWLQAILCVMHRAKEREARIRRQVA